MDETLMAGSGVSKTFLPSTENSAAEENFLQVMFNSDEAGLG